MKRIALLSACILSAAAFFSCSKQDQPSAPRKEVNIIHATLQQPVPESGTKTELGGITSGKYPILWSAGDAVAMVAEGSTVKTKYTLLDESAGQKEGKFSGDSVVTGTVYAYYPYENVKSISGNIFTVSIPETQTYAPNSFGKGAMPAYGETSTDEIQLKSLMSVLKVQLTGSAKVSRIRVISTGSFLSGQAEIDMTSGAVTFASGSSRSVVLVCEDPVQLTSDPTAFHIVLPACVDNFKVAVMTADAGSMEKTLTNRVFKVNTIKKINPVEFSANVISYVEDGTDYGKGIKIGDVIWAPVNCGVGADSSATHGCGLLYQWGRIVGTGYNDGSTYIETMQTATPATWTDGCNKSPEDDKFYTVNSHPHDWYTNSPSLQFTEWPMTAPEGTTGIGNPCPSGWRVPTYTELSVFNNLSGSPTTTGGPNSNQIGFLFGTSPNQVFLPAAGQQVWDLGISYHRNIFGFYWSSSRCDWGGREEYPMVMYFNTAFAAENSMYRASGYSVRCVQE